MSDILEAIELLRKRYANPPKRYALYAMRWRTWCWMRRQLKAMGIPVTYVYQGKHKWVRFIDGVRVHVTELIETNDVLMLEEPKHPLLTFSWERGGYMTPEANTPAPAPPSSPAHGEGSER